MKSIFRLGAACLALRKIKFQSSSSKLRALVWTLKTILPESCRFIDHNFRPYFSYSNLDANDRKFLQSILALIDAKNSRSMYLNVIVQDIKMLLGQTNPDTEELVRLCTRIYHLEPLSKPLRMIEYTPKAKVLFSPNRKLAPHSAEIALRETYFILESLKLEPFLMSGTLLGLIRENKFLSHDIDIDIGVVGGDCFEQVRVACEKSSLFISISSDQNYVIKLTHKNGIILDIFFHWSDKNKVLHGSTYLVWQNTPFDYSFRSFYDQKYRIPKDYDTYLTENYGNWKLPKPEFNILYDTPNVSINQNWDGIIYLCLNTALAYQANDLEKLQCLKELIT